MFHSLIGLLGSSESRLHPAIKPGFNTPLCMSDFGVFYLLTIILSAFAGGHESCSALSSDRDLKPLHPILLNSGTWQLAVSHVLWATATV